MSKKLNEMIPAGVEAEKNIKNVMKAFDEKMELMKRRGMQFLTMI